MTRIQSSVGLITGIPIEDTVNKLMAVASQPKTILTNRTRGLESEKLAVAQLTSLLVAFQFETTQLGNESLFDARQATSSNASALSAAVGLDKLPAVGSYLFTPVQTASAQQLMSRGFAADEAIGAGSFTFGTGGFVDQGISLDELNSGDGVRRGKIRITDRNGESAVIDLSFARTVEDVLRAINEDTTISVTAEVVGDTFKLTDNSGGSGNLKVQEVAGGATAAHLGLAGLDVNASTATGNDVFTLHSGTALSLLNDGNGVQLRSGNDLSIMLADGSTVTIDLGTAKTLDDVLKAINAASPTKVSASIGNDGNRLKLTDLTAGAGAFSVANVGDGTAADDLGLTTTAAAGIITGQRLASGLRDTLVSSLKGGAGFGALGEIDITNRNNVSSSVNLSSAETLGEIIAAINAQATGVTAGINSARNGIVLTDTTGATASNFIVANGDANNTASALGILANDTATKVNSGPLDRQQISEATLLSSLNGGAGIDVHDFKITGTNGVLGAVDLNMSGNVAKTVGDVLARINALAGVGVEARINDRGDGIVLIDIAAGAGNITVTEVGNSTAARDLRILGTSTSAVINGTPTQVIDGTATATVTIDADDTLSDLVTKINELGRGVTATIVNDGTRQRLSIAVDKSGSANALRIDMSETVLEFDEISSARDALLLYGASGAGGVLISSSTNEFNNVVEGINLTVNDGSLKPVTVSVKATSTSITSNVKEFVAAYNSLRDFLGRATEFNAEDQTTGILFGTQAALRVDSDISRVITARFFGVGEFQSLETIGISVDDKGKLKLDESKLTAAFNKNPDALKKLFTDETRGLSAQLDSVVEKLAGESDSVLSSRTDTLTRIIEANKKRLEEISGRLDRQRERLLLEFFRIETTVAKMRDNLSALAAFQAVPPLTSSSSNSR